MMQPNHLSRLDQLWEDVISFYTQEQRRCGSLLHIGIHSYDHLYRVRENVKQIERQLGNKECVNYELTQAAAILHDIGYLDITAADRVARDHVQKSVGMSKKFLQALPFTEEEIVHIQEVISGHHSDRPEEMSLEQKILLLADQLDLLGLDGTLRELMRASSKYQNRDEIAQEILTKSRQRYAKLIQLKICERLVTERWRQSEEYLMQIIDTGTQKLYLPNGE